MIKKVFNYDFVEARKNNNNPPFIRMVLDLVLILVLLIILLIIKFLSLKINSIVLLFSWLYIIFFVFKFISDFSTCSRRLVSQMSVFVVKKNGDIFKIVKTNYGLKDNDGGISINQLINGGNDKNSHLGMFLGFFYNIKSSKEISTGLSSDKVVNTILKNPEKINDCIVYKIGKVYELIDCGRYYIIKCDYYDYHLDKECINSLIKFNKSYNDYEQLVGVIQNKIGV